MHWAGLVTAFGHVSCRVAADRLLITPPVPLGRLTSQVEWTELDLEAGTLPAGVPKEAWIHLAIARRRPDVGAICQLRRPSRPRWPPPGCGSCRCTARRFLGPQVPVFDDAVLVRDEARAVNLAERLGDEPALLLRGNGAVTVGADIGEAVARMWVLEASAQMNSVAAPAGTPTPLSADEQAAWRSVSTRSSGGSGRPAQSPYLMTTRINGTRRTLA